MDQPKKGYRPKIGDVFEIDLKNGKKAHVQYIGNDITQLNSDVIRVFKARYPIDKEIDIENIISDEIEFYSHVTGVKFGIEDGSWKNIGNSGKLGDPRAPFFRTSKDVGVAKVGEPKPEISKNWVVWHMNEPMTHVGELLGEDTKADIGVITWPKVIVNDMRTGKQSFFYPGY
jgi:hypothetical protein